MTRQYSIHLSHACPEPALVGLADASAMTSLRPWILGHILAARGLIGGRISPDPGIRWARVRGRLYLHPGDLVAIVDDARHELATGFSAGRRP